MSNIEGVATSRATEADSPVDRYGDVRRWSEVLCEPLEIEDYVVQSMPDASPTKWHLAHTTWFFEALILRPHQPGYRSPDEQFNYLFNSYYNTIGRQFLRPHRGLLSRPTVAQVREYRDWVDGAMTELLAGASPQLLHEVLPILEVGLNHEQQHQELMVTDLKHAFARNPLQPVYRPRPEEPGRQPARPLGWRGFDEGLHAVGWGGEGFAFDNEGPRHRVFVEAFEIADRLVTCGEYLDFMADGGYERPELWLSDGWARVREEGWRSPLYWASEEDRMSNDTGRPHDDWHLFTLAGTSPVDPTVPVSHLSLYEADAYARWAGARLPSEEEWEVAADAVIGRASAGGFDVPGANFVEEGHYAPRPSGDDSPDRQQFLGDLWEWTRSAYSAYPGYRAPEGPLGEYNSKFMSAQNVLRGGSCATPRSHIRTTYRNFFPPHVRWQFSGVRLARDV